MHFCCERFEILRECCFVVTSKGFTASIHTAQSENNGEVQYSSKIELTTTVVETFT